MPKIASQGERTRRAVAACRELLDTADWLRERVRRHLEWLELTMMEYRVLETLQHDGPQHQKAISQKLRSSEHGVALSIKRLENKGWVEREQATLPASASWAEKAGPRATGHKILLVHLTPEGKKLIAYVFPKYAKLVKGEMQALEGREQLNLSRLCRKLRGGEAHGQGAVRRRVS